MEWFYLIAALASSLAAVLAWLAKLAWAKEFREAKDETLKAKDAQIELLKNEIQDLRELTPMKLKEYFVSVKQQLEEYNDKLQQDLTAKNEEISNLLRSGQNHVAEFDRLVKEKGKLETKISNLENTVKDGLVGDLIRRSFFGFDLQLKGNKEAIQIFIKKAAKLGTLKSSTSHPLR